MLLLSKIKFLLKSTNEHGVHSPFVFSYLTECLYAKPKLSKVKRENVLLKSIPYFGYQNFLVVGNPQLKERIKLQMPNAKFHAPNPETAPVDLVYFRAPDQVGLEGLIQHKKLHNDSMLLVDSIHKTAKNVSEWNRMTSLACITVSMDLFYCGLLFVRREQEKEHFSIRF